MLNRFAMVLAACSLWTAYGVQADDAAKDEAKLNGTWTLTSYTRGGNTIEKDDAKTTLTFENGKYKRTGINFPGGSGTYKVDMSKKPAEFNFTPDDGPAKGREIHGILEIDGNKLKICACGVGKRPEKFDATEKSTFMLEATKEMK